MARAREDGKGTHVPPDASDISTATQIRNVHDFVEMPRIGRVYRGLVSVALLAKLLRKSRVRYAPNYQRGYRRRTDDPIDDELLLPLWEGSLDVRRPRAEEMAVKYLLGELFSASVIWNARREKGDPDPVWDPNTRELTIFGDIAIPDTAHRHMAYYFLDEWKRDSKSVPANVLVNDKPFAGEEIRNLLKDFDPDDRHVFVEIYNLSPEDEGKLYDQFNFDAKPPQRAVGIALAPTKTPARRFVLNGLMRVSPIFAESEIEMRSNTIGSDSRKLTTNSTLVAAAEDFKKLLLELEAENDQTGALNDMVLFFSEFFSEYASHFPEFQPGRSADERHALRARSFALSNIMFHPLFRIAKDIWAELRRRRVDWRVMQEWRDGIARIAGTTEISKEGRKVRVEVMSRENPEWVGKILIETWGPTGKTGVSLSNTRQTRQVAYEYLIRVAQLEPLVASKKSASST